MDFYVSFRASAGVIIAIAPVKYLYIQLLWTLNLTHIFILSNEELLEED